MQFRALIVLALAATSSFGCSLARGVTPTGPTPDTGGIDGGGTDGSVDGGIDGGGIDTGMPDAFVGDTGIDAFVPDTGVDAFVPDAFVPECATGETRCMGSVLQTCTAGLLWGGDTTCSIGCVDASPSRCSIFVPSNVGPSPSTGLAPLVVATTVVVDTTACTGVPGLAIEPQLAGARNACVLRVESLTVTAAAVLYATGNLPLIIVSSGDVQIDGRVDASSFITDPVSGMRFVGAGGGSGGDSGDGGGGPSGIGSFADGGGGGGALCGDGGDGGDGSGGGGDPGGGGDLVSAGSLEPLIGGANGGDGGSNPGSGGPGGGAIQISSYTRIAISATALLQAAGAGGRHGNEDGNDTDAGGGGGSGGALLIEAPSVSVDPAARLNVGGGGGASGGCVSSRDGNDGADSGDVFVTGTLRAPGGAHACPAGTTSTAGAGAGDASTSGANGSGGVTNASGGGGGSGCIYFRTGGGTAPTTVSNPTTIISGSTVHSM